MVIILILWHIRRGKEKDFRQSLERGIHRHRPQQTYRGIP